MIYDLVKVILGGLMVAIALALIVVFALWPWLRAVALLYKRERAWRRVRRAFSRGGGRYE